MQVLAVVRAEDAELNEAMRVYREFMNRVGELRDANKPRWLELVRFALLWVANRRPEEERAEWIRATEESQNERLALEEVRNMENTIAHSWLKEGIKIGDAQGMAKGIEKGIEKGMEKGRSEGRSEGRIEGARSMILRLGRRRFGVPTDSQSAALEAMNDIVRLESLGDMVSDASSWDDLLRMG